MCYIALELCVHLKSTKSEKRSSYDCQYLVSPSKIILKSKLHSKKFSSSRYSGDGGRIDLPADSYHSKLSGRDCCLTVYGSALTQHRNRVAVGTGDAGREGGVTAGRSLFSC